VFLHLINPHSSQEHHTNPLTPKPIPLSRLLEQLSLFRICTPNPENSIFQEICPTSAFPQAFQPLCASAQIETEKFIWAILQLHHTHRVEKNFFHMTTNDINDLNNFFQNDGTGTITNVKLKALFLVAVALPERDFDLTEVLIQLAFTLTKYLNKNLHSICPENPSTGQCSIQVNIDCMPGSTSFALKPKHGFQPQKRKTSLSKRLIQALDQEVTCVLCAS
jgi:hypothetical protein